MKLLTTWITSISLFIGASAVGIAAFSQVNFKAAATASNIPPALTKLSDKSYLLTWTDNFAVYVSCYPTVKPRMKPAPIKQTPNRYVITCKNK
ncbi:MULTISPECIES: hypothetical protein [unclassified Nostoc]|uniref:hypothetical protein n=1 Tax=unclassified Nostoc TaxID=2593658 RepID=UPI002AD4F3E2|nr:hypothetical protein [Nostoc sp. DedQUE03]MDZ7977614.1 hypothetical protein [Nostoc sp. DedQUE03]MDZ8048770.1 hypothetical protein [Nostoc sp. DedQUE02]